jgi:hypothetical protein
MEKAFLAKIIIKNFLIRHIESLFTIFLVKYHIEEIKLKLDCNTNSELIDKLIKLESTFTNTHT